MKFFIPTARIEADTKEAARANVVYPRGKVKAGRYIDTHLNLMIQNLKMSMMNAYRQTRLPVPLETMPTRLG